MFSFLHGSAPADLYTLSLHDALPICNIYSALTWSVLITLVALAVFGYIKGRATGMSPLRSSLQTTFTGGLDRKSTRLNSSHPSISYAVFCSNKKTTTPPPAARAAY